MASSSFRNHFGPSSTGYGHVKNWRTRNRTNTHPSTANTSLKEDKNISPVSRLLEEFNRITRPRRTAKPAEFNLATFKNEPLYNRQCEMLIECLSKEAQPPVEAFNILMKNYANSGNSIVAIKIYEYILAQRIADHYTFTMLIQSAAKNNEIDFALRVYAKALELNQDNDFTFNCILVALKRSNHPSRKDIIQTIHSDCVSRKRGSDVFYASLITNTSLVDGHRYYKEAKELKCIGPTVYSTMIYCALRENDIDTAHTVFNDSRQAGVKAHHTVIAMLLFAKEAKDLKMAQALFLIAINDSKTVPSFELRAVENAYLDVLWELGRPDLANRIFDEQKLDLPLKKTDINYEVDLHESSYARVYLGLQRIATDLPDNSPIKLKIICGRGLHTKSHDNIHPTLRATQNFYSNFDRVYFHLTSEDNSSARGYVEITFQPKPINELNPRLVTAQSALVVTDQSKSCLFRLFARCMRKKHEAKEIASQITSSPRGHR